MAGTFIAVRRALPALLLIAAVAARVHAQPSYRIMLDSGAYSDINGETLPLSYGDNNSLTIDLPIIGETYPFFGVPFPVGSPGRCQVLSAGGIRVDGDTALMLAYAGGAILGSGKSEFSVVDSTSAISYRRDGEPGNRILKFQWRKGGIGNGDDSGYVNMQMWIYQADGMIEFRYGPSVMVPVTAAGQGFTVGLLIGPSGQIAVDRKFWLMGDPSAPTVDSQVVLKLPRITSLPGDGRIIRLIPAAGAGAPVAGSFGHAIDVAPRPARDWVRRSCAR